MKEIYWKAMHLYKTQASIVETKAILRSMYLDLINEGVNWSIDRSVHYLGEMVKIQKTIKGKHVRLTTFPKDLV